MVMPDFDTWADLLTDGYKSVKISEALRQAFEQGYQADLLTDGYKSVKISEALRQAFEQGYQLGLNQGWAYQMDREYKDKEWVHVKETKWTPEKTAIYDKIVNEQGSDSSAIIQVVENLKKAFPKGFHNPED